ncbi:hypothetical protein IJE86_04625 [bacterium]|nr:hypothetical protein [bacterium]
MDNIIDELNKLDAESFFKEIQKEKIPSLAIAYFAAQEQGQGNVIKRWYAKAELQQRERKNFEKQLNIAKWSAIFSAISSICALITVILNIFIK